MELSRLQVKNKKFLPIFEKDSMFILKFVPRVILILHACIAVLKNIRNLNLRGNQFSGSLPVSLFAVPHLKFLDLSFNNLEGRFPLNLTSEPVPLEVLKLDSNYMSGALPSERGTA